MTLSLRFMWAALTLLLRLLVSLIFNLSGLFLVPVAIATHQTELSRTWPRHRITNAPKFLWFWGNDEDGYDPEWYARAHPTWNRFVRRYMWAAVRNPANNLRFIKSLHPPPDPTRIRFAKGERWLLCWQGLLYRFTYTGPKREYSIGWKYRPDDARGVDPMDHRLFGTGFGVRIKRID